MKHILFYIVLWLLLSVLSCTGGDARVRTVLAQADSLLWVQPDSALRLLQSLSPRDLPDRKGRMYYALLLSHAKYRNYIPLGSDSLLQEVAAYYAGRGDDRLEARARYLLGGFYEEQQDFGAALRANHEAAQLARRAGDYRLLCLVYNNQAYICLNHGLKERGDSLYATLYDWARQAGDSVRMAEALLRRGAYALSLGGSAYGRAERLIEEGFEIAHTQDNSLCLELAYASLYACYNNQRRYDDAMQVAKEYVHAVADSDSIAKASACLFLGDAYHNLLQNDSAVMWLQQALKVDDYAIRDNAYALLGSIAEEEQKFELSVKWKNARERNRQQGMLSDQKIAVALAAQEIEFKEALRASGLDSAIYYYIGAIAFLSLVVGAWIMRRYGWRDKKKGVAKQVEPENAPDLSVPKEIAVEEKRPDWDFELFKRKMLQSESYALWTSLWDYYKAHAAYERKLDKNDMFQSFQEIDVWLPGHREALGRKYPKLAMEDIFYCYLYMLDLSDAQVGVLICRERTSVYRMRISMLHKKMYASGTSRQDLICLCQKITGS